MMAPNVGYSLFAALDGSRFVSLKTSLSQVNRKCVHALYKNYVKEFTVRFFPVQKQTDGYNCGPFAIAFAAEMSDGKSPMEAGFDVDRM